MCHHRFPLLGKISCQLLACLALSSYPLLNTEATSESHNPAPSPKQADLLGHVITFLCFTALFESSDFYISLLSDSFPRKSTLTFWKYYISVTCFGPSPLTECKFYELDSYVYLDTYILYGQLQSPFWQVMESSITLLAQYCWCLIILYACSWLKYDKEALYG